MIRAVVSTLLQRLTTDVGALRRRITSLERELADVTAERDDYRAEASALDLLHDEAVTERDRLRAMVGNTGATPKERIALDTVRADPGKSPKDYVDDYFRAERAMKLADWIRENPPGEPPGYLTSTKDDAPWYVAEYVSKHLQNLHKKGLVRREKAGNSYRYWSVA